MNPKTNTKSALSSLSRTMEQDEDDGQSVSSSCGGIDLENMNPPTSGQTNNATTMNGRSPTLLSMVHHKWRKIMKRDSAEITQSDPSFKTIYLGNVVTTWAKGDGCLERPASALWKNHCQGRGSIKMLISTAPSGLKAQTREHGLTEYWANRLTYCGVPPDYPKLFCWIYRHEGRKLKQELRCHAVLCSKEIQAHRLANSLKNRLTEALFDFKKEKILRQNARLSIVSSLYNNSATKRKLVLMNSNSQNYKPPLERSKSAPKLSCIEEFEEEENEEDYDDSQMAIPEYEAVNAVTIPTSYLPSHPSTPLEVETNGDLRRSPLSDESSSSTLTEHLPQREEVESSPISHRKSYPPPNQVIHHPEGSRRPHTIPMDAKLNLPYMTGYDKVMHLLDMPDIPAGDSHQLLLDDEDQDDDQFSFAGRNSDPVASSPGSDRDSESVVDSSCGEDEYSKVARRRRRSSSCDQKHDDREEEINDNVSDESGYSEEAVVNTRGETELKMHPSGSPVMKSSTKNLSSSTIIIMGGGNHHGPMITDPSRKTKTSTTTTFRSDDNGGTAVATTLVVYDNLCFEI